MLAILKNNISLLLFKNQNYFLYNLFNLSYSLIKCKKKNFNSFLTNFINLGYSKSKKISISEIEDLKIYINKSKKIIKENVVEYDIDAKFEKKLKKFFLRNFSEDIICFQDYFNSKVFVTHVKIFKNIGYSELIDKNNQYYSENYHTDNYIFTYFKLFINLEEIDQDKGPLHFIPKISAKDFIKRSSYKNRYSYNDKNIDDIEYKNTGRVGESIFVNTTQNFHRAGIPKSGKSRTVILFHLNAVPTNKDSDIFFYHNNLKEKIFHDDKISKLVSKPQGILKTLKLIKSFILN